MTDLYSQFVVPSRILLYYQRGCKWSAEDNDFGQKLARKKLKFAFKCQVSFIHTAA